MRNDERDLAAMLQRVLNAALARERKIFAEHQLPMWDYVALVRLEEGASPSQSQLAVAMGRDRTRVIETIDRLEQRALIRRRADPADRRNRIIELTTAGGRVLTACRADIRTMEQQLLAGLPPHDRDVFVRALRSLDVTSSAP
ncbi:MAG: MarR family transcriptional regulator [Nakamurella sp.]